MSQPKQLPQKFAAIIEPKMSLMHYVHRAAMRNELDLPDEYHFEDLEMEIVHSVINPDEMICRITATVVAGPPVSTGAHAESTDG